MTNLIKQKHAAGGYQFFISEKKGNTRFGKAKQQAIIYALLSTCTEGVYLLENKTIKRQLLNGTSQFLKLDKQIMSYCFV
jgi:hypothetical protein